MKFYSTNNPTQFCDLREAVFQGLPADNGLFMPSHIPELSARFFDTIEDLSLVDIAWTVCKNLLGDSLSDAALLQIVQDAFDFEVPIVPVEPHIYCLELFHGPTLAFKDFGARFMARLMSHYLQEEEPCILVATSGDTGSAVAQGFYQVPGIKVVILYPSGKVSSIQEQQLTTVGAYVVALEIDGTFDDCQKLVKTAFLDDELSTKCCLSSANSINIARLIPQSIYYFWMYARLKHLGQTLACSVPSGNFGNLMGGLLAKRMGLPIERYVASNNANKVFYEFLRTQIFEAKPSVTTVSNAMDVGNPSNFVRILDLYSHDLQALSKDVVGYTFDDVATKEVIAKVYNKYEYILDPHGAVGYLGLKEYLKNSPNTIGVFLGTAHPVKFLDVVQPLIPYQIPIPRTLQEILKKRKQSQLMDNSFSDLKSYLLSH